MNPWHNWDYNLAMLIAGVVVWVGVRAHRYWLATRRPQTGSSPTANANPLEGVKTQLNAEVTPILTPFRPKLRRTASPAGHQPQTASTNG